MRVHNILAVAGSLVVSFTFSAAAQKGPLKVDLSDAQGKSVGTAELSPAAQGVSIRLKRVGIPDIFCASGSIPYLVNRYQLDAGSIAAAARALLRMDVP